MLCRSGTCWNWLVPDGATEPEALEEFLRYLGDGVIVGHHIAHDV
jgi:DNA polymerase III epsilon subunit-like protein